MSGDESRVAGPDPGGNPSAVATPSLPARLMQLWIDADACPKTIKEFLFQAAVRLQAPMVLVANSGMYVPRSALIRLAVVGGAVDEADRYILAHCAPGDLVVSADIPLARGFGGQGGGGGGSARHGIHAGQRQGSAGHPQPDAGAARRGPAAGRPGLLWAERPRALRQRLRPGSDALAARPISAPHDFHNNPFRSSPLRSNRAHVSPKRGPSSPAQISVFSTAASRSDARACSAGSAR